MDELLDKFKEWSIRNEVHMDYQLNVIGRFAMHTRKWVDTLYARPADVNEAVEKRDALHRLNDELKEILDEAHDMFDGMANDYDELMEIFEIFGKELEKLPDDTPE